MEFFKRLLRMGRIVEISPTPNTSSDDNALRLAFDDFLTEKLAQVTRDIRNILSGLDPDVLPGDTDLLHIEIFEEPMYEMRLFAFRSDGVEAFADPETWSPSPALQEVNAALDALQPILTQEELDRFTIWEEDAEWGRQEALEQPLDAYDAWRQLGPFSGRGYAGPAAAVQGRYDHRDA